MNKSEVQSFLMCLSRMTSMDHQHHHKHNHENEVDLSSLSRTADATIHDHDAHSATVAKATAMAVLFCATTICGAIPFLLNKYYKWTDNKTNARSATVVKCLLYFGGGVLLCTTFMHLLPEVQETVESLQECGTLPELTFPLAELLMCLGFFAMFFIEELIHAYIHNHQQTLENDTAVAFERGHSIRNSFLMRNREQNTQKEEIIQEKEEFTNGNNNTLTKLSVQDLLSNDLEKQKINQPTAAMEPTAPVAANNQYSQQYKNSHDHSHSHSHDHQGHSHLPMNNGEDMIASSLRGLLIVLALSLHELFEGLAIGLEGSASTVWFMFAAVSAHKLVLAFCVGVELIVARTRLCLSIVYVLTFAIVSPIGIGIGILISKEDSTASSIPSVFLQGLACGTLLYVVFFEILSKNRAGLLAYLALFVGFSVMFGLQQIAAGHEHSHGCSSDSTTVPPDSTKSINSHLHNGHSHAHDDTLTDDQALTMEKQLQVLRNASVTLSDILKKASK